MTCYYYVEYFFVVKKTKKKTKKIIIWPMLPFFVLLLRYGSRLVGTLNKTRCDPKKEKEFTHIQ